MMSVGDESDIGSLEEFVPIDAMPTGRLQDIMNNLQSKSLCVCNLDACLPPKINSPPLFRTLLHKISERRIVKTLSLRFNNLSGDLVEILIGWLETNDFLQTLYFMGTGIDEKVRQRVEDVWKKHLSSHRRENYGFTLTRVPRA